MISTAAAARDRECGVPSAAFAASLAVRAFARRFDVDTATGPP